MSNRKTLCAALVLIAALSSLPRPAEAQGTVFKPSPGLSLQAGFVLPADAFQDNHLSAGAAFLLPLTPNIFLEVGAEYARIAVRSQEKGLSQGRVAHIPALLGLRLRFPLRGLPLVPVLTAGAGYAANAFSPDKSAVETFRNLGFTIEESCRSAPLAWTGVGVEILLSTRLVLDVRGLYRISRTSSRWSITDQVTGKTASGTVDAVNLNAFRVTAGLRLCFN